MAIFDSIGEHGELNLAAGQDKTRKTMFPVNTADDVYIDENGHTLSDALPKVNKDATFTGFLDANEEEEVTLDNADLIKALTENE